MVARKGTKEASKIPQLSSSRKRGTTTERVPGRGGRWTNRTCSIASEISALVAEQAFAALKAPIVRVARADAPVQSLCDADRGQDRGGGKIGDAVVSLRPEGRGGHSKVAMIALK